MYNIRNMSASAFFSGTPPVVPVSPYSQGTATIALLSDNVVVNVVGLTATSVVVCWGLGAVNATATSFDVDVVTAGSFTIKANAAPTVAAKNVGWAVLKL